MDDTTDDIEYFYHHIVKSNKATIEGINNLKEEGYITKEEYVQLIKKQNDYYSARLNGFLKAIRNFILLFIFVPLFTLIQINTDSDIFQRTSSSRTTRSVRSRSRE